MSERRVALLIGLTAGWLAAGCLYRVTPPPTPEAVTAANAGPPVMVEAPPPDPTPTIAVSPGETATPPPTLEPPPAGSEPPPTPEPPTPEPAPTESPTPVDPVPVPTLGPTGPITHTFDYGESFSTVVAGFVNGRLERPITQDEVLAGVRRILADPDNQAYRARPSLVYAGQVVTLTALIRYTEELRGTAGGTTPPGAPR